MPADYREFLTNNTPVASGPIPSWAAFLIELVGISAEEIKELIMTSAGATDQAILDAANTLMAFETTTQATLATLTTDLQTVVTDVQAAVAGGGVVQPSTLTSLQNAVATLGTIGTGLSTAVTSIDQAVNPPAPSA